MTRNTFNCFFEDEYKLVVSITMGNKVCVASTPIFAHI